MDKNEKIKFAETLLNSGNCSVYKEVYFSKAYPEIYEEICAIDFPIDFKFSQKLWHYIYDDYNFDKRCKCELNGKLTFLDFRRGYRDFCKMHCSEYDRITSEKRKNTRIKNCGSIEESYKLGKLKQVETCLKKYGTTNGGGTKESIDKIKQTKINNYGSLYNLYEENKKKSDLTRIEKCGSVENSYKIAQDKRRETLSLKSDEYFDDINKKIKQTKFERYGSENYVNVEKCKQTCLEKYGVENYSQSDEFKNKFKTICLEKYGVENPFQFDEFIEKSKETNLKKYGFEYYTQTGEYKKKTRETCLEKYGVENYSQTIECKNKVKQSFIKKYGVENYSQTNEFAKYHRKSIKYDGLTFDSSWEVKVYKYCQDNNISCEYQPNIRFEYVWRGKKHIYQPDFLIDEKLYEVKGEQFFDGNKMICPFDRNLDGIYEAKHQCMIDNGVVILRKEDIIDNNLDIFNSHKYLI